MRAGHADVEDRVLSAVKARILNPDVVSILVAKVNRKLREIAAQSDRRIRALADRTNQLHREIQNLVKFVAAGDVTSAAVKDELASKEAELGRLSREIRQLAKREPSVELAVQPSYVTKWLNRLEQLIEDNPVRARN